MLIPIAAGPQLAGDLFFPNEQARLKASYGRTLRRAMLASLALLTLVFLFSPLYRPTPYRLHDTVIEVVELAALETVIPPEPEEIRHRPQEIISVPDETLGVVDPIIDPVLDPWKEPIFRAVSSAPRSDFLAFDHKPELVHRAPAAYPEMARDLELSGTVLVNVLVDVRGRVADALVVQSVHPVLDREALRAARASRFVPGRQRDQEVPVWVSLPFRFELH